VNYTFDRFVDRKNSFSAKWDELGARFGRADILPMWVADMDLLPAQPVVDAVRRRAEQGIYSYTARPDTYYEAMIDWYRQRHGLEIKKDWIIHSPGIVTTLSLVIMELTAPGDKIVIQPPVYPPFFEVVKANNRIIVENPLIEENGNYRMDYDDLAAKSDDKVKYVILCNPHNPVGRVWTKDELIRLGNICLANNVRIIADEIHADIVFDNHRYSPFAAISEAFRENSITALSATKTFNMAGLQASFAVVSNRDEYRKIDTLLARLDIRRNNCFSLVAVEAAYRHGGEWLAQLLPYLNDNIDYLRQYCREKIPAIKPNKPEGTYLVWLDCRELGLSDGELADFMTHQAGVALNKGTAFGTQGSGFMRMNVACPRGMLTAALERMEKAVNSKAQRAVRTTG